MTAESIAVIFVALSIGALAKGMTGLGLPPIAISILAVYFGVEHAVVVTTIPVAFSNIQIVWTLRSRWREVPSPWVTLIASVTGVAGGTWILANIDDRALTILLAVWIAFYLATVLLKLRIKPEGHTARLVSPLLGLAAGIAQGATGMSGPFIATWAHAWGFVKESYVFATSLLFMAISCSQVVGVSIAGLYDHDRIIQGLLAIIPVVLFVPLGMRLTSRISPRAFNWVIVGIIVAMEAKLVWGLVAG